MKIIISPAKKMIDTSDEFKPSTNPLFLNEANQLHKHLKSCTKKQLKEILKCNDALINLNYERFQTSDINNGNSMALVAYQGLQYQAMAPHIFTESEWNYANEHVVILSGLYGMLRPTDAIIQYRLEMQAKLKYKEMISLYEFWGNKIVDELNKEKDFILNLASKEYSDVVKGLETKVVTCVFGELVDEKVKIKATLAKMARGAMVRYLATNQIITLDGIKQFSELGFTFVDDLSSENELVFVKKRS